VIAAAFAGHHLKATACVSCGGTGIAEMDEGGQILFLLWDRMRRAMQLI
jgi:hypothetical protein